MNPQPHETTSLASLIQRLAGDLANRGTGELAELRRLKPDDPRGSFFWRVVVTHLDRELPSSGERREDALRRWAVILRSLAHLDGLHNPGRRFGAALAEAGVSELRLNKLLRASGDGLFAEVRSVTHQLASKGVACDVAGIARLVLGRADEHVIRQAIANDYYARIFRTETKSKENV